MLCPRDKYCPGSDVVFGCPGDLVSTEGSNSIANCMCPPGFYGEAGEEKCSPCDEGEDINLSLFDQSGSN